MGAASRTATSGMQCRRCAIRCSVVFCHLVQSGVVRCGMVCRAVAWRRTRWQSPLIGTKLYHVAPGGNQSNSASHR